MRELTLPKHYASALINCDYTGMSDEDTAALNTALALNDLSFGHCVDYDDVGFLAHHDAKGVGAADCYVFKFMEG